MLNRGKIHDANHLAEERIHAHLGFLNDHVPMSAASRTVKMPRLPSKLPVKSPPNSQELRSISVTSLFSVVQ